MSKNGREIDEPYVQLNSKIGGVKRFIDTKSIIECISLTLAYESEHALEADMFWTERLGLDSAKKLFQKKYQQGTLLQGLYQKMDRDREYKWWARQNGLRWSVYANFFKFLETVRNAYTYSDYPTLLKQVSIMIT